MRKLILLAQISVDGFVAGPKGEFDHFIGGDENLEFVCSLTDEADAALFGRISYDLLNSNWPAVANRPDATKNEIKYSNWYNRVPKIVLSRTSDNTNSQNTIFIRNNISAEIEKIKNEAGKNILLFGSPSASHLLMEQKKIDSLWLIIHPVMFGDGIPLFRKLNNTENLQLLSTKQFSNGTIALQYDISHKR